MSYIGNQPSNTAFLVDTFSGNGSTTAFTMTIAPATANSVFVIVSGVVQSPLTYSVVGNTLTFSQSPPTGTNNIVCRYLALPASNVTTTAYRNYSEFTATLNQTTFTPSSYTLGFIDVYRNGVKLNNSSYTAANGTTVVLGTAAASGDSIVIISFFVSSVLNAIPNTAGSVGVGNYDVSGQGGTGAFQLPAGTTGQRPGSPSVGMQRWNSTLGQAEIYVGGALGWQVIASTAYTVDYLVVGGGGGGGNATGNNWGSGGGGGGGGFLTAFSYSVTPGTSYTVTVGGGGSGATTGSSGNGTSGGNSSFGSITAIGGGYGASANLIAGSGGSGGGQGYYQGGAGSGTTGQGNNGGTNGGNTPSSGGGGGAGAAGSNGTGSLGGVGGIGLQSGLSGTTTYYAGGGGGGFYNANLSAASGGQGGGGAGGQPSTSVSNPGVQGTNGLGGGGGGGSGAASLGASAAGAGANGGSGVVIIRYSGSAQRAIGGAVTYSGGYVIHTFTSSGSFTA